ncbi:hypothetical protein [Pseudoduganella violaceinigra]|uniref:hypothetical protein n=1 Tax=Pseudoduganella violaceinigra TaxID=246602 RepID=UPI00040EE04F|nr:hypothetical protein [Pseudoduganella violaceinigra]
MSKLPISVGMNSIDKPGESKALVPLDGAANTGTLMQRQVTRMLHNGMLSAGLVTRIGDPVVWGEWMQLQAAVMRRLNQQNLNWSKGCEILANDAAQIRHANTMSKLAEKQCNLVSQWALLLSSQTTDLVTLMENIHVDYGYWASQKLRPS